MRLLAFDQEAGAIGCYRIYFPGRHLVPKHTVLRPKHSDVRTLETGERFIEYYFTETIVDSAYDPDVYLFQQFACLRNEHMQPYIQAVPLFRYLKQFGKPIICDSDDDYVNPPRWNMGGWNAVKMGTNVMMMEGFREADLLTVSTPHLAELYSEYNSNIRVIRNRIHWPMWENVHPNYDKDRPFRVGWVGSFEYRKGDLELLRGVIGPWLERNPDVEFVAAGSDSMDVHDFLGVPVDQRVNIPFIHFDPETGQHTALYDMDVCLVPLDPIPFNEGKSHLKGMEINAAGGAFIASPSESYRYWTREGENGFFAKKPKDWFEKLDLLKNDRDLCRKMGETGRRMAEENDYGNFAHEWEDAWTSVLRTPSTWEVAKAAVMYGAIQKPKELEVALEHAKGAKVIVEIGSAAGGTMWSWGQVAAPDATIISIDLIGGGGGGDRSTDGQARTPSFARHQQTYHVISGDSHLEETKQKLLDLLDGRRIDFLFIDGDHTYEGVKADWEMYGPLADTVAFHDIVTHTHPDLAFNKVDVLWAEIPEPKQSVVELLEEDPMEPWGGIGIVEKAA